jgi:23S rRNA pseudouridine1911/1915/1917 synthase
MNPYLEVMAEASGVVAVAKPAGLPTQAPPGIDSAENRVRALLVSRAGVGAAAPYLGVPHRLDRAVSGVLLFATTPRAARKLARQFERREVTKTYLALVVPAGPAECPPAVGAPPAEWRDWIEKVPDEPRARRVEPSEAVSAKEAITRAQMLGRVAGDRIAVQLEPLTGRMHQLRLQAASRGLPVVGDELYGGPAGIADAVADDPRSRPIALHAWRIRYLDPETGEPVTREAPLPDWWPPIDVPVL